MSGNQQEIEAKFYVRDLASVEKRLQDLDAKLIVPRQFEYNLRYDDEKNSLTGERKVLRLRRYDDVRLTFKGPGKSENGVLSRTEIELIVNDFESARLFLEGLGYHVTIVYEKYRAMYELEGRLVTLDELPYGKFVEIEGDNPEAVRDLAQRLGLQPKAAIPMSYHSLFDRFCFNREMELKNLSFAEFEGINVRPADLEVTPAD
jgi:adenylate cyclase class 2